MSNPFGPMRARRAGIVFATVFAMMPAAAHAAAINLGTAGPFVVLGGSSVTNTGVSVLNGDLGVSPGTSMPGFNAAVVNGATHNNDAVAGSGQSDLTTAYNLAAAEPTSSDLTGQDLGGLSLTAGGYHYASSAQLTGQLTLDAQGDPAAQFVFKIGSSLTTASASSVRLLNGASPCNVFWQVGSSATLGSTTALQGTVMALTSITLNLASLGRSQRPHGHGLSLRTPGPPLLGRGGRAFHAGPPRSVLHRGSGCAELTRRRGPVRPRHQRTLQRPAGVRRGARPDRRSRTRPSAGSARNRRFTRLHPTDHSRHHLAVSAHRSRGAADR